MGIEVNVSKSYLVIWMNAVLQGMLLSWLGNVGKPWWIITTMILLCAWMPAMAIELRRRDREYLAS